MEDLHARYGEQAEFLAIYVRETHPFDPDEGALNDELAAAIGEQLGFDDRLKAANHCSTHLEIGMPLLVDDFNDRTANAYSGVPNRMYVIDREGWVTYKSGRGPAGLLPGEMEQSLIMTLLEQDRPPMAEPPPGE